MNAVEPGWVKTNMAAPLLDDPEVMKYYVERIALHRGAEPEELAATIAFLLTDDASYVTCRDPARRRRLHRERGAVGVPDRLQGGSQMQDPASIVREAYERVRREYGSAIGQRRDELITPALVLDIDAAQRNIDRMAGELRELGRATIRPHYKTHKSPDLARRQLDAGAGGLSMATVWEAAVLAAAGMDDLFVVNTVAHPAKLRVLAELARDHRVLVAVDEAPNAAAHSAAAVAAGSTIGIMIEVDTGMDRCGVDTAQDCLAARPAGGRACPGCASRASPATRGTAR